MSEENEVKQKKKLSMAEKRRRMDRLYRILYVIVWPFFNLVHPIRTLHRERLPEGGALICPNHTSNADPVIVLLATAPHGGTRAMSKQEMLDVPVLGKLLAAIGVFGIRRGAGDVTAIKTAIKFLRAGDKVIMFPEGHRATEGEMLEAKNGVAMLALRTGAPIVPVYISPKKRWFRWTYVVVGEPFTPTCQAKRPTDEDYHAIGEEWKRRVNALEAEVRR